MKLVGNDAIEYFERSREPIYFYGSGDLEMGLDPTVLKFTWVNTDVIEEVILFEKINEYGKTEYIPFFSERMEYDNSIFDPEWGIFDYFGPHTFFTSVEKLCSYYHLDLYNVRQGFSKPCKQHIVEENLHLYKVDLH